jgi:hypothetical protein
MLCVCAARGASLATIEIILAAFNKAICAKYRMKKAINVVAANSTCLRAVFTKFSHNNYPPPQPWVA